MGDYSDQLRRLKERRASQGERQSREISDEILDLEKDLVEYRDDLKLVTEPFAAGSPGPIDYQPSAGSMLATISTPNDELKWVFWLTLGILFLELFMLNNKYDFLNVLPPTNAATGTGNHHLPVRSKLFR